MKLLDVPALQKGLRTLHGRLTEDLVARADLPEVSPVLKQTYEHQVQAKRTGEDFTLWRRHFAAQVASSWILSTLFVRVLEDRGLLPRRRLAGEGAAGEQARESRETIAQLAPHVGSREYLLLVFQELMTFEATKPLFDPAHDLAWRLGPSETVASEVIAFWQQHDPDEEGRLLFAFDRERAPGTRFLGDVYEELDPDAKKRFALLQTPDFVESFILDRTLTPALKTFGLGTPEDPIRLIDPTCGSGHFLLGAFHRLVREWERAAPAAGRRVWVERALKSVAGVDINPYAVAIARFRLTVEAFDEAGVTTLIGAPLFATSVTTADSLLGGKDGEGPAPGENFELGGGTWTGTALFEFESPVEVRRILGRSYHVVVGNPPYITPKDPVLNAEYRRLYSSCHREYSLVVPFIQRLFELGVPGGHVGAIVANSYMRRQFGTKLIENYLPSVNLTNVYDTAGAFIPGHGTPTIILVGRRESRTRDVVTVAMGKRGEPERPKIPALGSVWATIAAHGDELGFENEFISVAEVDARTLSKHPWSLGGGGAAQLKDRLEKTVSRTLASVIVPPVGAEAITGENNAFIAPSASLVRFGVKNMTRASTGDFVRNYSITETQGLVWPHDRTGAKLAVNQVGDVIRYLWPVKALIRERKAFKRSLESRGLNWWSIRETYSRRLRAERLIVMAKVATHNHFACHPKTVVFDDAAPVLELVSGTSEEQQLEILGLLGSSTLGFWMRQVFHCKGAQGVGEGIKAEQWEQFYEYDGTKIKAAPLASATPSLPLVRALDELGRDASRPLLTDLTAVSLASHTNLAAMIAARLASRRATLDRMHGLQEDLDWLVYEIYGLLPKGAGRARSPEKISGLKLGHRPFEIVLARRAAAGEHKTAWFERHGSTPVTEIPSELPKEERDVIAARLELVETVPEIALIEQPEYKRRWSADDLDARVKSELRELLLDRIETELGRSESPRSVRALAHELMGNQEFRTLAQVYTVQTDVRLDDLLGELLADESVPAFVACRYTETGLEKRGIWERVWDLQRREDAGEKVEFPETPKYGNKDFQGAAWAHRGKLDVPKERFVSYPGCEPANDPTPLYGWAGWDHVQKARALAEMFDKRRTEDGWDKERLKPLLSGVQELVPWLLQWHNEPSDAFGGERPGEAFRSWLETQLSALALSPEDVKRWRPPKGFGKTSARRATTRITKLAEDETEEGAGEQQTVAAAAPPEDPPRRPERPRRAPKTNGAIDPDRLLSVLQGNGGTASLAILTEALKEPQRAVREAADALVKAGRLVQTKQRPITYAVAGAKS